MDRLLVDQDFIMEKYPGKGGWTYIILPGITYKKKTRHGMVKVWGHIDQYELKDFNLFSAGKGKLFLPVKQQIRKAIGKQEGDSVHLVLYAEDDSAGALDELLLCLEDYPEARLNFDQYTAEEQQIIVAWIEAAKNDEARVTRISRALDLLERGQKPGDLKQLPG